MSGILASFRAAAFEVASGIGHPTYSRIPDDVAALPAVVVGRPSLGPGDETVISDLSLDVWAIGRRVDAGDPEGELDGLADEILDAFGGTRAVRHSASGFVLEVVDVTGRTVDVGGLTHPAYTLTVETSTVTC